MAKITIFVIPSIKMEVWKISKNSRFIRTLRLFYYNYNIFKGSSIESSIFNLIFFGFLACRCLYKQDSPPAAGHSSDMLPSTVKFCMVLSMTLIIPNFRNTTPHSEKLETI